MRIFIVVTIFFGLILGYGVYLKETYVRPTRIIRKPAPALIVPPSIPAPLTPYASTPELPTQATSSLY